ncbi:MAG: hypothetical protein H6732_06885 [Alphaproteobacteria bacterium]|nr:hypothetical protein [Alphaproteobacteria bacterium]
MPVVRKSLRSAHPHHDDLVEELCRHLRGVGDLPPLPRIVEDQDALSSHKRVYVLWPAWDSVVDGERAVIILEAYERALGTPEMLSVSVAVGVTPREADAQGLDL